MVKLGSLSISIIITVILCLGPAGCNSGKGSSNTTNSSSSQASCFSAGGSSSGGTSTSLSWNAPFQYTNGDPIASGDIAAYKIYCSTLSGVYSAENSFVVQASLVSTTTLTVNSIVPKGTGTIFFVVTAIDKNGNESGFSAEVSRA